MTDNLEDRSADPGVEEVLDEIIDLEEYARLGKHPPLSKGYRILVNGEPFVVHAPSCLISCFDGAFLSRDWKDALWDKFCTAAPRRRRRSVERYSIVKRA